MPGRRFLASWFVAVVGVAATGAQAEPGVWTSGGPQGGHVNALAVDPSAPAILYAGTYGGVFRSSDGGTTWRATNTGLPQAVVRAVQVDPTAPARIYAGSDAGVSRSTNGGRTWAAGSGIPAGQSVRAVAIDALAPATIYAGAHGVYKSTDGGSTWLASSAGLGSTTVRALLVSPGVLYAGTDAGVFTSRDDGASWVPTPLATWSVYAFVADPDRDGVVFAATSAGVFRTTNAGASWSQINTGLGSLKVNALALASTSPATLYAATETDGTAVGGVFRSTDGGLTWAAASTGLSSRETLAVAIGATPTTVYVGSLRGVDRSTDAGGSWAPAIGGLTSLYVTSLGVDPATPSRLYAGCAGRGVLRSTDGGGTWAVANTGLGNQDALSFAFDPTSGTTYAGTYSGVFRSTDTGETWTASSSGLPTSGSVEVVALALHHSAPATLYAASSSFGVFKSSDAGQTWLAAQTGLTIPFVNALAIDPSTPARIYAGTDGGVFRSTDAGGTWAASSAGLTTLRVWALAVDPSAPSTLYAGTFGYAGPQDGGVFKSTDGGDTWSPASSGLTNAAVRSVVLDAVVPTTVYAGTGTTGLTPGGGVFRSTDAGASWNRDSAGLPNGNVLFLASGPLAAPALHAGLLHGSVYSRVAASPKGDLDRNGSADLVFRNASDGARNMAWLMNGTTRLSERPLAPDAPAAEWRLRGVDDFDADRNADLVLWNEATGEVAFWLMNGTARDGAALRLSGAPPLPANWELAATADLNADSWPDLVWRNTTSQKIVVWTLEATMKVGALVPVPDRAADANWELVGARDFDGDGHPDLLWFNRDSGRVVFWLMDGALHRLTGQFANPPAAGGANWKVLATGDYGVGPGGLPATADLVWRNATSGRLVVWHLDHAGNRTAGVFTSPDAPAPPLDWTVVAPR